MTPGELHLLNNFILTESGMNVPESNVATLKDFIRSRLKVLQISLPKYLNVLKEDKQELEIFFSGITINETYFFREERQYSIIRDYLMDLWNTSEQKVIQLWSASCSSGEEALSLYSLIEPQLTKPFQIWASDVSRAMLDRFKKGMYRTSSFRKDGHQFKELLTPCIESQKDKKFQIRKDILGKIKKQCINVYKDDLSPLPSMDLIFFRNTLIYMSPQNKELIVNRLAEKLNPGGVLLLSVSETPLISHPALKLEQQGNIYFFRKRDQSKPEVPKRPLKRLGIIPPEQRKIVSRPPLTVVRDKKHTLNTPTDPTLGELCRSISFAINNPQEGSAPVIPAVETAIHLLGLLEKQLFSEASDFLKKDKHLAKYPGLHHFFRGYIKYIDQTPNAAEHFRQSLDAAPELWPARFYLCRTAGDHFQLEKKDQELNTLLKDIRHYINAGRYDYQFMLEGFNARYFEMICEREREQLCIRRENYVYK